MEQSEREELYLKYSRGQITYAEMMELIREAKE